ncbi:hypothetical protein Salat_0728300 [Sesamum alatum]|uniref:Uncharacterized protein n=1 Tax=Sesamum alatum TaxID=300844 RepID=A0AAE2CV61_9LAMI|nr:hypothetical protein Salat_0728300 [Sesamum alatum]
MAVTPMRYALVVASLGVASFLFGVSAELKKPASGHAISGKGVVICKYSSDLSVVYGYISIALLAAACASGYHSLFYPYKGKGVPRTAIFGSRWCNSYVCVAFGTTVAAAAFLLWPTVEGHIHHIHNVHTDLESTCPTAKTGLLGGGAFMSLNSALFWLLSLMLVTNAREDYFELEENEKKEHI